MTTAGRPAIISAGIHLLAIVGLAASRPKDARPAQSVVTVEIRKVEPVAPPPETKRPPSTGTVELPKPPPPAPKAPAPKPEALAAGPKSPAPPAPAPPAPSPAPAARELADRAGDPPPPPARGLPEHTSPAPQPVGGAGPRASRDVVAVEPLRTGGGGATLASSGNGPAIGSSDGGSLGGATVGSTNSASTVAGTGWGTASGFASALYAAASGMGNSFSDYSRPGMTPGGGGGGGGFAAGPAATTSPTPPPQDQIPDGGVPQNPDAACTTCDETGQCIDLQKDVNHCGSCSKKCRDQQKCTNGVCTGGDDNQWVVDSIQLSHTHDEYAVDLNNDGKLDNDFFNFIRMVNGFLGPGALEQKLNGVILAGWQLFLLDIPPPQHENDPISIFVGIPTGAPRFDGTDQFLATTINAVQFYQGVRQPNYYKGLAPPYARPENLTLHTIIQSNDGVKTFEIRFRCHQIEIVVDDDQHLHGFLRGTVLQDDILQKTLVGLVGVMEEEFATDMKSQRDSYVRLFDNGNWGGGNCGPYPGNKLGIPGDKIVEPCEVYLSPGVNPYMQPDLEVWTKGVFDPKEVTTHPDSISFALQWSAVRAKFKGGSSDSTVAENGGGSGGDTGATILPPVTFQ